MPMPAHMTLTGESQGKIDGSCSMSGRENTILVEAFNHEVRIPRELARTITVPALDAAPYAGTP